MVQSKAWSAKDTQGTVAEQLLLQTCMHDVRTPAWLSICTLFAFTVCNPAALISTQQSA